MLYRTVLLKILFIGSESEEKTICFFDNLAEAEEAIMKYEEISMSKFSIFKKDKQFGTKGRAHLL